MQKNSITNKITPCCGLPFSVMYWFIQNITLSSETDRSFIFSKLRTDGSLPVNAWTVLINSGTLETDAGLNKQQFLEIFNCRKKPTCAELKLIIEGFKVGNWTPETEFPPNIALIDAVINGINYEGNVYTKEQVDALLTSSFGGDLVVADNPQPTSPKWYFAKESGTYANAGNLVVDLTNKIVILNYDGTAWGKVEINIPLPNYSTVLNPNSTDKAETGKSVSDYVQPIFDDFYETKVSPNLFNDFRNGMLVNSNVDLGVSKSANWNTAIAEIEAGKTYTISGWNSTRADIALFSNAIPQDFVNPFITGLIKSGSTGVVFAKTKSNGVFTFTALPNSQYIVITTANATEADSVFANLQIEEGSVATQFMPFGSVIRTPKTFESEATEENFEIKEIIKSGSQVLVRTDFNNERDLVSEITLNGSQNGATNFLNVKTILKADPITAVGFIIHPQADAVPTPFQVKARKGTSYMNIAGNHGMATITDATATAHGKTSADLLSVWRDSENDEFYLGEILSANSLRFVSKPFVDIDGFDKLKSTPLSPLVHVSGATNTGNLIFTGTAYEYKPSINSVSVKLFIDEKEITADGTYKGNEVKIIDTHNVVDPTQPTLVIPYLPQNNGIMVKNTLIHTFYGNGSYTAENIADWQKNHKLNNQGIIQPQALSKGDFTSVKAFAMNMGIVGTNDFKNGVDFTNTLPETIIAKKINFTDSNFAIQQLSEIIFDNTTPKIGVGFGYNPLVGVGKSEELLLNNEHFEIRNNTLKAYLRAYNERETQQKIIRGIGYYAYWDATKNPKLSADYFVPFGKSDLYFLNVRLAMTKEKVYLNSELLNREFEVVHKSDGLTIHTTDATTSEGLIVTGTIGDWAVLKIK